MIVIVLLLVCPFLATEEVRDLPGMEKGEERETHAAAGKKRGNQEENIPMAKRQKGSCTAPKKGKWRVDYHDREVSSGLPTTSSNEVCTMSCNLSASEDSDTSTS